MGQQIHLFLHVLRIKLVNLWQNNKKTITLNAPILRPNMIPAKKIPMFCNTIGTGINGKGTPGTNPKMQIMAVIKAVKLNFCTHLFILLT